MNEDSWDRLLKIRTSGRDDTGSDQYKYPYEPTPYLVLERLGNSGEIGKKNTVLDYGCGKGRVDFFLSYQTGCRSVGIEYNERFYQAALRNQEKAVSSGKISFIQQDAAVYQVPAQVDRCFFFNPFCLEILKQAMARIMESWYENQREIRLYFYYPSQEYEAYLNGLDELQHRETIRCMDLFPGNDQREKILIFSTYQGGGTFDTDFSGK